MPEDEKEDVVDVAKANGLDPNPEKAEVGGVFLTEEEQRRLGVASLIYNAAAINLNLLMSEIRNRYNLPDGSIHFDKGTGRVLGG